MDNFEHYIREKFENYTVQPSDALWNKIHKRIKPWYTKPLAKLSFALSLAILITGAIIGLKSKPSNTPAYNAKPIKNITFKQIPKISTTTKILPDTTVNKPINKHHELGKPEYKKSSYIPEPNKSTPQNKKLDSTSNEKSFFTATYPKNKLKFDFGIYPTHGCAPLKVNFWVKPPKGMHISWFINKTLVSDKNSFSYTLSQGTHFIQLVIYDSIQTVILYDTIQVNPHPVAQFQVDNCQAGKPAKIKNLSQNANTFVWIYGDGGTQFSDTPSHIYQKPGIYRLKLIAKNNDCSDTATDLIVVNQQPDGIVFPNAFVPNTSGPSGGYYNPNKPDRSIFHPVARKPVAKYKLQIFDRRGKLLFQTTDINQGWDGYYRNQLVPIGVYIYVAQGTFQDGETFFKKGDITVIYSK